MLDVKIVLNLNIPKIPIVPLCYFMLSLSLYVYSVSLISGHVDVFLFFFCNAGLSYNYFTSLNGKCIPKIPSGAEK